MKTLILLEHTFIIDEDNRIWSETVIDYNYLKRYLNVFEKVVLCARMKKVKNDDSLLEKYNLLVSGPNIEIEPLPFVISPKEIILSFNKTKKIFKKAIKNVNCVIIRGPSLLSLLLYKYCVNKIKFAVEFVMGANEILSNKNIIRKIINIYLDNQAKKMCLKANGVSYVTKGLLQEKYPSYSIKYNSSKEYFDTYYSSIDLYKENFSLKNWGINNKPSEFLISHIGSMHTDRKGQERLIYIVNDLLKKGYKVKVKFMGDGRKKEELKELARRLNISENLEFLGNINDRNKLFNILKDSHFFVLPTSSEGLPRSIIEAMATATPCIASNVDGIPELLSKEDIFNYNDIEGFSNRIGYLMDNWNKMIEKSNRNYTIAKEYEYEILKEKRMEFYQTLKNISNK